MATEFKGNSKENFVQKQQSGKFKIGIAVSEWNDVITESLKNAAIETLHKYGYSNKDIIVKYVPGSFELPLAAKYLIDYADLDGVICLGCVIQGETRHFDFVCQGVTQGVMDLNMKSGIPVSFGVLTTENQEQAKERAGGRLGNKGEEAALAVLKMIGLKTDLMNENKA